MTRYEGTGRNSEGYADPTPMPYMVGEDLAAFNRMAEFNRCVLAMAKAMRIKVLTRIELRDGRTGTELRWE